MPYERPGGAYWVTAGVDVRHGAMAADDGFTGRVIKQGIPAADTTRANRDLVVAGEAYIIRTRDIGEVDNTNLPGIALGALVYIDPDDNAIAAAQAGNNVVLGKVVELPGVNGTPSNRVRVDLELKA